MKKALTTLGNNWQIYLSKIICQLLGISEKGYSVQLKISNKTLYVEKSTNNKKGFLVKKLIKRGAGYGLNLPLPILELLDINPEVDLVDINIENNRLIIKKAEN